MDHTRPSPANETSLALLARVGRVFASSLDYETTLRNVIAQCLPALGDFGFFDVVEDAGVRRLALAYEDPRRQQMLEQTRWMRSERQDLNLCALSSGVPGIHPRIDDTWLRSVALGPEHLQVMRDLSFGSMITVPLRYERKLLGALTLFYNSPGRQHDTAMLETAEEVAHRAAAAVINARLYASAQAAIRGRDDFLSVASHELRTPLTAMQLQVESLLRSLELNRPIEEEKLRARLTRVDAQLGRLNSLIEQLLDVGRLAGGRLVIERQPVELGALLRELVEELHDQFTAARSRVEVRCGETLEGQWDRARLEQVFTNLLTNALRYGESRPVEVTAARQGDAAVVRITDHGIGIDPVDHARIFERFERASASTNYGGLGLGLWIVRELVALHGGSVAVESTPGSGATFAVVLPFSEPVE